MKKQNVPTAEQLAEAWRKHPAFGTWHWHAGRWNWLSPNGNGYSRCGVSVPVPKANEVQPHHKLRWQKCSVCSAIKPWGGCGPKTISTYNSTWQGRR